MSNKNPTNGDSEFRPSKINMEPKNHLIEKENHLPNLHFWVPNVKFPGCNATWRIIFFMINVPLHALEQAEMAPFQPPASIYVRK